MTQNYGKVKQLQWTAVVVGKENPEHLNKAFGTGRGYWTCSKDNTDYPIDIVLGLDQEAHFYRIDIAFKTAMAPKKIKFKIGRRQKDWLNQDNHFKDKTSNVNWEYEIAKRANRHSSVGQWLWMIVDVPFPNEEHNPFNQICLISLVIYGTTSLNSFHHSSMADENSLSTRRRIGRQSRRRASRPSSTSSLDSFSLSHWDEENGYHKRLHSTHSHSTKGHYRTWNDLYSEDEEHIMSYSGLDNKSADHATMFPYRDPLQAIQAVRDVLHKKKKQAIKNNREVEAQFCHRAIERIQEDVQKMQALKRKLASAQLHNDMDYVAHYKTALKDVRDTCFRSIHLDLLFNQDELNQLKQRLG
uniref:Uncharacterized protein n=1 Tax=Ditylenchus dipsaci TaxID=166011 RepID=A0A915CUL5_9BILA